MAGERGEMEKNIHHTHKNRQDRKIILIKQEENSKEYISFSFLG